MLTWLGPVLVLGGFLAYFASVSTFAVYQRVPWAFLLVMTVGLVISIAQCARRPSMLRGAGAAVSVTIAALAGWYLFAYSMFDVREARPRPGDTLPRFALATSDGGTFRLEDARGRWLMLLFYRGDW